jgi:hypothetical protein
VISQCAADRANRKRILWKAAVLHRCGIASTRQLQYFIVLYPLVPAKPSCTPMHCVCSSQ